MVLPWLAPTQLPCSGACSQPRGRGRGRAIEIDVLSELSSSENPEGRIFPNAQHWFNSALIEATGHLFIDLTGCRVMSMLWTVKNSTVVSEIVGFSTNQSMVLTIQPVSSN